MSNSKTALIRFQRSTWKIAAIFLAYLCIYYLSLRFIFPGYFSPFVPHHSDILDYPYDLAAGGIAGLASRPVGLLLNALFGLIGAWRGVVAAAVLFTVLSMLLVIRIVTQETKNSPSIETLLCYGVLVFVAPTFYLSYSFDIFGTYALTFCLAAVALTYSEKLQKKPFLLYSSYFLCMLLGFLSKETYLVTFCFFSFVKAVLSHQETRKKYCILFMLTCVAAAGSLLYGKVFGNSFTSVANADASSPYYVSLAPSSVAQVFEYYLKGLCNIPVLLLIAAVVWIGLRKKSKAHLTALLFCLSGVLAYLPYSVLPNKVVPHYIFSAVPMVMAVVFLCDCSEKERQTDKFTDTKRLLAVLLCGLTVISYSAVPSGYSYSDMKGWIACESDMALTLQTADEISQQLCAGEEVLVCGIEDTVETAYRAWHAPAEYFPRDVNFDVLTNYPVYCGHTACNITYISSVNPEKQYDKIITYSETDYSISSGEQIASEMDKLAVQGVPELTEDMIYPGIVLDASHLNDDGSANVAVIMPVTDKSISICVNGEIYPTAYAEGFISVAIPNAVVESSRAEICLYAKWTDTYSDPVKLRFEIGEK